MTRKLTYLSVAVLTSLALLASCTREDIRYQDDPDSRIHLRAAISANNASLTRSLSSYSGILSSSASVGESLEMGILRADQKVSSYLSDGTAKLKFNVAAADVVGDGSYDTQAYTYNNPHYYVLKGDLSGDAGYRDVDFSILQYYKGDDNAVHYCGWVPYGTPVANGSDTLKVNFNLDGKTDVLYSGIATHIMNSSADTMKLHHALCQYRVWVYRKAEIGEEGNNQGVGRWGRITGMTFDDMNSRATLTLPSRLSYSNPSNLALETALPGVTLDHDILTGASNGVFFINQEKTDSTIAGGGSVVVTHNGVTIPVGLESRRQIACFVAPPPAGEFLNVHVSTDASEGGSDRENQKEISIVGNFKAGKAYDIILCFSDHGVINASANVRDWVHFQDIINVDVEAKMYYDLSRYGTANSYMVSSANVGYSFQGDVMGCGNANGGGDVVGVSDCSLPQNTYVELLYQSCDSLIQLDSRMLINGKVVFWVPGYLDENGDETSFALKRKGNAIIAVRNGNGGEILWSWHIWVTDRPLDQGYLNGYEVMDRNLGATSGPHNATQIKEATSETYGLYYQWGRKDPIIPGITKWDTRSLSNENDCISTGIKNPFVMYSNWNVDSIEGILGYRNARDNIKSIYDPCPPGYRMPESEAFKGVSERKISVASRDHIKGGAFSGDNNAYFFYPDAGFVSANNGVSNGNAVSITEANNGGGVDGSNIYLYTTAPNDFFDGATGNIVKIANLPTSPDFATNQAASAFSVRCISTNSKARVQNLCEAQTANCYVVPEYGGYKFRVDIKGNGVDQVNIGGSVINVNENISTSIPLSSINHVAVLWWQGDLSSGGTNNTRGRDCPIKFVNDGKTLPRYPSHTSDDFGDDDITVPDSDGFVNFYIEESKYAHGNAVVAAFDQNNNILWSWHLWLTDEPSVVDLGPTHSATDNYDYEYSIMDRNLGATYHPSSSEFSSGTLSGSDAVKNANALASLGLYYQWGRKDPVQGPDALSTITAGGTSTATSPWYLRNISGDYSWQSESTVQTAAAETNASYATGYPWIFFTNNYNANSGIFALFSWHSDYFIFEKNWYRYEFGVTSDILSKIIQNQNNELPWSEVAKFIGRWGYNTQDYNTQPLDPVMTKTLHDPCPPGYFMPPVGILPAMNAITSSNAGTEITASDTQWTADKTWSAGSESRGYFAKSPAFSVSTPLWIPFGGYRDYEDAAFNTDHFGSGNAVAVWASALDFNSKYYKYNSGVRSFVISGTGAGVLKGQRPADGTNVRCRAY